MTTVEFTAWTNETRRSRHAWQVDACQLANHHNILAYTGGQNGQYILIAGGSVELGRYAGAVPHIGEAVLTRLGRRDNTSEEAALASLRKHGIDLSPAIVRAQRQAASALLH